MKRKKSVHRTLFLERFSSPHADLSTTDLRRAAQIKEQIDALTSELSSILGVDVSLNPQPLPPKTKTGGRRMPAAAAKARWAKAKAAGKSRL